MTLREAAEYLNCHYSTVFRLAHRGQIPAFRVGADWRLRRSDIDQWIRDRQVKPEAPSERMRKSRSR